MSDKKHIDRLFQEKFKDFEATPNDSVWEGIEARLDKKKKKRRVIPIWWFVSGAAAALLLLFAVSNFILKDEVNPETIVDVDKVESNKNNGNKNDATNLENQNTTELVSGIDNNASTVNENASNAEENANTDAASQKNENANSKQKLFTSNGSQNNNAVTFQNSNKKESNSNLEKRNTIVPPKNAELENTVALENNSASQKKDNKTQIKSDAEIKALLDSKKSTNAVAANEKNNTTTEENKTSGIEEKNKEEDKGQSIEDAIAESKTINEEEKEIRRWSIAPNVAPVYFNSLGDGSSIDPQLNQNNRSSDITMSYGVKGSYAINDRLKITTGVNRVNFSNTTNDVIAMSNTGFSATAASSGNLENVTLRENNSQSVVVLVTSQKIDFSILPDAFNTVETGDLTQNFGFIEIPLEIEYRLVDKKLGVNLSGGFSTLLLNENEIYADVNGQNTLIGEANNFNDTSFSANFGVGLDYSLTEKININLEPKFKYQLNTFKNTTGDFRPFFIGVYTGLSFKF